MKKGLLFQKSFVWVILFLSCIVTFRVTSVKAELVTESDIIKIATPSSGQTLYGVKPDYQDIAVAKDGSFVVTWAFKAGNTLSTKESYTLPIYARRFDANGTPLTDIIEVCDSIPAQDNTWNISPIVACDDNGNFVVCWSKSKLNVHIKDDELNIVFIRNFQQIYARLFDMDGNPLDDEFQISENQFREKNKPNAVAMNGDGEFVITWTGDRDDSLQSDRNIILMKRFDNAGQPKDSEPIKINSAFEVNNRHSRIKSRPSVAINAKGGIAVTWSTRCHLYSTLMANYQGFVTKHMVRQYNQYGLPMGPAKTINITPSIDFLSHRGKLLSDAAPVIAMNDKGNFAVSHYRYGEYYGPDFEKYHDAAYRFFSKTGIAQSPDCQIEIFMQHNSLVNTMDSKGNLVMGWKGCGTTEAIYIMQVSRILSRTQEPILVVENPPGDPTEDSPVISYPALDASADGRVVVIWHDNENLLGKIYTIQ